MGKTTSCDVRPCASWADQTLLPRAASNQCLRIRAAGIAAQTGIIKRFMQFSEEAAIWIRGHFGCV